MNIYKTSAFIEFLGQINDKWILYNNLSGALIEVDTFLYTTLRENQIDSIKNEDQIKALRHGQFIVDADIDQAEELKKTKEQMDDTAIVVGMQILPAKGCNFNCTYCFEKTDSKIELMSREVMDDIIAYVREKLKPTTRYFNISWFGGEPLLAVDRIEYLSEVFLELCREKNITYKASIVTNGYLLSPKNIDTLTRCKVDSAQVTIDGPAEIHDGRRMLKNGGKTRETIMENLKHALTKSLDVAVRINIDKTNVDHVYALLEEFKVMGIFDKVKFSLGLVTKFGDVCRSIEDNLLTMENANELIEQKKIVQLLEEAEKTSIRPYPDFVGCVASAKNSLCIGSAGEIYKCSKTIGDEAELCGHISNVDWQHPNIKKWSKAEKFDLPKCRACSMIPVCNGTGCMFDELVKGEDIFDCNQDELKRQQVDYLTTYYKKRTNAL